jgi:hypothetical protein
VPSGAKYVSHVTPTLVHVRTSKNVLITKAAAGYELSRKAALIIFGGVTRMNSSGTAANGIGQPTRARRIFASSPAAAALPTMSVCQSWRMP